MKARVQSPTEIAFTVVRRELQQAQERHAPLNSHHEAYAVIREELDEYWEEVKKRSDQRSDNNLYGELIQVAAMAIRAMIDVAMTEKTKRD